MSLKVGLQLYSIREAMRENPAKALAEAAKIGYRYFELANLSAQTDYGCGFGMSAKSLKCMVEDVGCTVVSAHIDPLTRENIPYVLDYHSELGTRFLMSKPFSATYSGAMHDCELYNYIGEKCAERGIQHCLHTGLAPFLEDGSWLLDVLFANTTPANMQFEVDTYWMMRSGFDPVEVIHKFSDRVVAIHQKDLPKDFKGEINVNQRLMPGETLTHENFFTLVNREDFCEVGSGQMNIQAIIDAANNETNAEFIILEQDYTQHSELESIRISYDGFQRFKGVEA